MCIMLFIPQTYLAFLKYVLLKVDFYYNGSLPTGIYLLKVNNRNTRRRCKICSKLTTKTPE